MLKYITSLLQFARNCYNCIVYIIVYIYIIVISACVCEVGSIKCGECFVGTDGGGCGGITTTADSNFAHHYVICRTT